MNLTFVQADKSDTESLKELWLECFDEKESAADLFFERNIDGCSAYCAKDGEAPVAALYLIHGSLNGEKAHYLCGACTKPEYRRLGIMARLIAFALNDAEKNGDVYSLLFPANEGLYEFYEKFGYYTGCSSGRCELSRAELENLRCASGGEKTDCGGFEAMQKACFRDNFLLQSGDFADFAEKYYKIYGAKSINGKGCFALFEDKNGCAEIFYSVYSDLEELKTLLLESTEAKEFAFVVKADSNAFRQSKINRYGMIKPLARAQSRPSGVYIGITLN